MSSTVLRSDDPVGLTVTALHASSPVSSETRDRKCNMLILLIRN